MNSGETYFVGLDGLWIGLLGSDRDDNLPPIALPAGVLGPGRRTGEYPVGKVGEVGADGGQDDVEEDEGGVEEGCRGLDNLSPSESMRRSLRQSRLGSDGEGRQARTDVDRRVVSRHSMWFLASIKDVDPDGEADLSRLEVRVDGEREADLRVREQSGQSDGRQRAKKDGMPNSHSSWRERTQRTWSPKPARSQVKT